MFYHFAQALVGPPRNDAQLLSQSEARVVISIVQLPVVTLGAIWVRSLILCPRLVGVVQE